MRTTLFTRNCLWHTADRSAAETGIETPDIKSLPLCVDLDGSLLRTDVLFEGIIAIATDWRLLHRLPCLLTKRGAPLKQRLAELATIDPGGFWIALRRVDPHRG